MWNMREISGKGKSLMNIQPSNIIQRLWNYCNVLRDNGMFYGDYVEWRLCSSFEGGCEMVDYLVSVVYK